VRIGPVLVERSGRWLRIGAGPLDALRPRHWRPPGRLVLEEAGLALTARLVTHGPDWTLPRGADHVAFDAGALPADLLVRARRPGDRLVPFGSHDPRRVKSVLADAGVPRWERGRVPIVEGGGRILWVAGVRRGDAALVTAATQRILEVTVSAC
jgi:tRNA(Ile)-lysidine synthase